MGAENGENANNQAGLTLMFVLGGFALLVFLCGIAVIYYVSYL